jgi:hypothetical protein
MSNEAKELIAEVKSLERKLKEIWEEMYLDMIATVIKKRAKNARKLSSEFGRTARMWRVKSVALNNLPQEVVKQAYNEYKQQKSTSS